MVVWIVGGGLALVAVFVQYGFSSVAGILGFYFAVAILLIPVISVLAGVLYRLQMHWTNRVITQLVSIVPFLILMDIMVGLSAGGYLGGSGSLRLFLATIATILVGIGTSIIKWLRARTTVVEL